VIPSTSLRIAVLHGVTETPATLRHYSIATLAALWQSAGHTVIHVFGFRRYEDADIAVVHVNLSVVPPGYLSLARRYPTALNLKVTDIRKSKISQNLVRTPTAYDGPVIVKSNLNYAGLPEWRAEARKKPCFWRKQAVLPFSNPKNYPIYASSAEVPESHWKNPAVVVEKFRPEYENGFYYLRQAYFLGERHRCWRLRSAHPIVRSGPALDDVEIPTPPSLDAYRRRLGLDYGKIDFVEHDGQITVLDVNKTIGAPAPPVTTPYLAPAIEAFTPIQV
jgi:hypothetical protein